MEAGGAESEAATLSPAPSLTAAEEGFPEKSNMETHCHASDQDIVMAVSCNKRNNINSVVDDCEMSPSEIVGGDDTLQEQNWKPISPNVEDTSPDNFGVVSKGNESKSHTCSRDTYSNEESDNDRRSNISEDLERATTAPSSDEIDVPKAQNACDRSQIKAIGSVSDSFPEDDILNQPLLGLPIDSLHSIASFLTPQEFCNFGVCSKSATKICRDVIRRVRMHGFRCATEVVTAWKMNQHSDAKELCALYISEGVPIYPRSLGHSYHTLAWRMGIEAQEIQNSSQTDTEVPVATEAGEVVSSQRAVDQFFAERYETRAREGLNYSISYLEEKALFVLNTEKTGNDKHGIAQNARRQQAMPLHRFAMRPAQDFLEGHIMGGQQQERRGAPQLFRLQSSELAPQHEASQLGLKRSNSQADLRGRGPKSVVKVHRHLLDQHLLGRSCVDDRDGTMTTSSINLNADFFHPSFTLRSPSHARPHQLKTSEFVSSDGYVSGELIPALDHGLVATHRFAGITGRGGMDPSYEAGMHRSPPTEAIDSDNEGEIMNHMLNAAESIFEPPNDAHDEAVAARRAQELAVGLGTGQVVGDPFISFTRPNILAHVDLLVYSASSVNKKSETEPTNTREVCSNLRARYVVYQRRLEELLSKQDHHGFDECLMDFWDEFFPHTESIQYYDGHTPVPRLSCLQKFLTKPCPKAIGVVQCEIERIKIAPKKKGVNMKGRFFPTYEYRLFIRHRPPETLDSAEPPRRDTVLMVAKNRGRKHSESSNPAANKKGANNYYLYVPQAEDVEQHFRNVNESEIPPRYLTNGASNLPMATGATTLMGRLQSNFIGTEFQIFVPRGVKLPTSKGWQTKQYATFPSSVIPGPRSLEEEADYDSTTSGDNPCLSNRRQSRFSRLSWRRNGSGQTTETSTAVENNSDMSTPIQRTRSSVEMVENNRRTRTSRRAIADNSEGIQNQRLPPSLVEEEDGAITYTANLLGSRPRIMDVCIPKVSPEGIPGAEWKMYQDKCIPEAEGGTGNRMLNHLKQIQQRLENEERAQPRADQEDGDDGAEQPYSPPDDFGLLALQNRPPWWNIELGSFVLNFGGRVSVASVKNFQLCDRSDQDYIMLQFGRIQGRHSFTMDYQHPLTAVQAFAIAISSLQSKISLG